MTRLATIIVALAACRVANADDAAHWAFRSPTRPPVPQISGLANNPIDAFLPTKGDADRPTLARRLHFDLTGLPPTPAQLDAFLADTDPGAYERLVDRLLASPHFGERWGQHWLDAVRFAESNGYELDGDRPHAWRYRDYVVRAFNADRGYDRFLTEQIAGDELAAGKPPRDVADLLIATGLHRCGPVHIVSGNLDKAAVRQESLNEMVNGLGAAVLGLTVACARCHDHKFDPLPQADYYRLQAYFAAARFSDINIADPAEAKAHADVTKAIEARIAPLKKEIAAIEAPPRARLKAEKTAALPEPARAALAVSVTQRTPEQKKLVEGVQDLIKVPWDELVAALSPDEKSRRAELRRRVRAIEAELPPSLAKAWAVENSGVTPKTHVLKRGDIARKGNEVTPGVPRVIASVGEPPQTRRELAGWLTRPDHPLTARVMVNRVWHHLFGRGIVGTIHDFGTRGTAPTHPELLDWLAVEFAESGWSVKHVVRLAVTSAAYRSAGRERKRLDAEAIRDAILVASGALTATVGGPGVRVPLEPEVYDLIFTENEPDDLWSVTPDVAQHTRRSLYLFAKRNVRQPLFEAFDQPDTLGPCNGRSVSTFAPQALILMNGPFARGQAKALADRLANLPAAQRVDVLYRRALGRLPSDSERRIAASFLEAGGPFEDLCLALFNVNDFVYLR